MFDRISPSRILDLVVPFVLLVAAGVGLVYAITIATTLQDLRAREPVAFDNHPDLETWRCGGATGLQGSNLVADGEPGLNTGGVPQHPAVTAERSTNCLSQPRQVRP